MNEFENTLTDVQEPVVEVQEPNEEVNAELGEQGEAADPQTEEVQSDSTETAQQIQTREDNTAAKAARLRAEQETAERLQKEYNANIAGMGLVNPFTQKPITTLEGMAEYTEQARQAQLREQSEHLGVPFEQLEQQYQAQQETARQLAEVQAEKDRLAGELAQVRQAELERKLSDDLTALKQTYPELKDVKHITEIGEKFIGMLAVGVDLNTAYEAIKLEKARTTKPVPSKIGSVNSTDGKEKDFYTSEEVDRLTDAELNNPKIRDIIRKSMLKW